MRTARATVLLLLTCFGSIASAEQCGYKSGAAYSQDGYCTPDGHLYQCDIHTDKLNWQMASKGACPPGEKCIDYIRIAHKEGDKSSRDAECSPDPRTSSNKPDRPCNANVYTGE